MIRCYVHAQESPRGTLELLHVDHRRARDRDEALRLLDTTYDLVRHRYASFLSEKPAAAAFWVDDPDSPHGARFQVSYGFAPPYSRVVTELNAHWLANRRRLAEALARR